MSIYVLTTVNGRGPAYIAQYDGRLEYWAYADDVLAFTNHDVPRSATIDEICDEMYDHGPGIGSRYHQRISRREAYALKRQGVDNNIL